MSHRKTECVWLQATGQNYILRQLFPNCSTTVYHWYIYGAGILRRHVRSETQECQIFRHSPEHSKYAVPVSGRRNLWTVSCRSIRVSSSQNGKNTGPVLIDLPKDAVNGKNRETEYPGSSELQFAISRCVYLSGSVKTCRLRTRQSADQNIRRALEVMRSTLDRSRQYSCELLVLVTATEPHH